MDKVDIYKKLMAVPGMTDSMARKIYNLTYIYYVDRRKRLTFCLAGNKNSSEDHWLVILKIFPRLFMEVPGLGRKTAMTIDAVQRFYKDERKELDKKVQTIKIRKNVNGLKRWIEGINDRLNRMQEWDLENASDAMLWLLSTDLPKIDGYLACFERAYNKDLKEARNEN